MTNATDTTKITLMNLNLRRFERTVESAKAAVKSDVALSAGMRERWITAIGKAEEHLLCNPFWQYSDGELLILSDSGETYRANGSCQCRGFAEFKVPCWHRCGSKLLKRYLEGVAKPTLAEIEAAPIAPKTERGTLADGFMQV